MITRNLAAVLICCVLPAGLARGEEPVNFGRDIQPILSDTCYHCHGPDAGQRQADLRLDVESSAKSLREGVQAVVPGQRDHSELWMRITSTDPELRMPPVDSGRSLTPTQQQLLGRWISEGAKWSQHWSFVAPVKPALPTVQRAEWVRNPVDRFVLARLEGEQLSPTQEADRYTLIRRLSFDLTGLPPTPQEVTDFVNDAAPDAYERLVDRLLSSPRLGERLAVSWLDLARYADTNGYQVDNERYMWRWRDWVIQSFNDNKPFDRFAVEQLAGDLLPGATLDQQIATGFNRNHPTTFEGGVIPEEYRIEYVIDRVNTASTAFLGLTLGCARCHDHKYDPFTQKEFYQLFAFFNNVPELGLDGANGNSAPEIPAPTRTQELDLVLLEEQIKSLEARLLVENPQLDVAQREWEQQAIKEIAVKWSLLKPESVKSTAGSTLTVLEDQSVLAGGPNPDSDTYELSTTTSLEQITGIRLEGLMHPSLPGAGAGRHPNSNFVLTEVELEAVSTANPQETKAVKFTAAYADYSQQNYEVAKLIDGNLAAGSGWAVDGPTKRENRVAWLIPEAPFGFAGGTILRFRLYNQFPLAAIGRFRLAVTADAKPYETMQTASAGGQSTELEAILTTPPEARSHKQQEQLRMHYRRLHWPEGKQLAQELDASRKQQVQVQAAITKCMVMTELPQPRSAHVLIRGQYDQPGEQVLPGVPAVLNPLPDQSPTDRRGLAAWMVDPQNPLTARVAVNRLWQHCFGNGLVTTLEDFGVQGDRPTHSELLDWLAVEFVESGWNIKALVRLIVTSATYRQSSVATPEVLKRDPLNRLLGRVSRSRFSAEQIRDNALAVSGLLAERQGGPSVKPYQPAGLWKEISTGGGYKAQIFEQDHGPDLYRRSLYTFWKRASPPPALQTFDAPTREYCVINRSRTNTPLQALVLMNDPTYVEAARALAERVLKETGTAPAERTDYAFQLVIARPPSPAERSILGNLLTTRLAEFQANPEAAGKLLSVGEYMVDPALNKAELAAWTTVASVLLNLDETVTKP